MASTLDISRLSFGAPAAERDIDQGLQDYFVESPAFDRVRNGQKKIILGNRGTGKSAIFQVLAERERKKGAVVLELAPDDYSYEMLSSVLSTELEGAWLKHGAYAAAWKYLILVLVMKALSEPSAKQKRTKAAAEIHRFLRDNFADQQASKIDSLISFLKRMEGFKVGKVEARVKTRELQRLYKLEELDPLLPHLADMLKRRRVLVFVDELDRGWDASEDAKAFVSGLFQACAKLNDFSDNLRVYVSLRQELYDSIPAVYEDAQKYRDLIEEINWEEASLLKLIANRIRFSLPQLASKDDDVCWAAIFSEVLEYRQSRSFNYMVDRTLYRPREMIEFATRAVEVAQDRAPDAYPVDYSALSEAENRYSGERTKDIAAEYRFQFPGLSSLFEVFRGHPYSFERSWLEDRCLEVAIGDTSVDESARGWAAEMSPELLIDVLWKVGFLRAQAVGGVKARRRSGSQYVGPHQIANLSLHNIARFQVHPMFRSNLGMKEPKSRGAD
ncbi:MAG TPA: ATP-binding protein [Solirubrobacterales bacterium]|nr:ATP-binding protein [Solirubrobacterales bacterium]